jgi:hypothetical protein
VNLYRVNDDSYVVAATIAEAVEKAAEQEAAHAARLRGPNTPVAAIDRARAMDHAFKVERVADATIIEGVYR